jgi:hypothetical protein
LGVNIRKESERMEYYYCIACENYSIEIDPDWLVEAKDRGLDWIYVRCPCGHLAHSDDTIENHIYQTAKIAGENANTGSIN